MLKKLRLIGKSAPFDCLNFTSAVKEVNWGGWGGSYFPYILLNEIQTMFSQLAKRSSRDQPVDLCTDHAHYAKNQRSTVFRRNKNLAVKGGTVSTIIFW